MAFPRNHYYTVPSASGLVSDQTARIQAEEDARVFAELDRAMDAEKSPAPSCRHLFDSAVREIQEAEDARILEELAAFAARPTVTGTEILDMLDIPVPTPNTIFMSQATWDDLVEFGDAEKSPAPTLASMVLPWPSERELEIPESGIANSDPARSCSGIFLGCDSGTVGR